MAIPRARQAPEGLERRAIQAEFRIEGDAQPKIVGYAAKFNLESEEFWGFIERIAPGAFKEALAMSDVRALFNHDPNYVLGRNKSGTLILEEDSVGLRYEITPPDTQWARDLVESLRRGDISQSSFAFTMSPGGIQQWEDREDGTTLRTIVKVAELYDVSPVTYPAYADTESGVRSAEEVLGEYQREREKRQGEEAREAPGGKPGGLSIARARLELAERE